MKNEDIAAISDNDWSTYPKTSGFALASGDIELFRLIYEYRFLRREHMSALTGRDPKRLHRRIHKLLDAGYLTRIRIPQQKHIYAMGKAALPVLVEKGIADSELVNKRLRYHELKPFFLNHEMLIVDFHTILRLATRASDLQLAIWQEGSDLYDSVTVTENNEMTKLPIRPDAFFGLEDPRQPEDRRRTHFFLEADRSSEIHRKFGIKMRAYWHYLQQGLHVQKFDIKTFRVLTVTVTHERARNLVRLAEELLPKGAWKYFLFTSVKHFSLENPAPIFNDICLQAGSNGTAGRPLVTPPAP